MPRRLIFLLLALLLALAGAPSLYAVASPDPRHADVDASAYGERVDISRNWLFTQGDNPAYASPAFDDHSWQAISTANELSSYGYHFAPFCWYRLHVTLPPGAHPHLVLGLQNTLGAYELYANGVRLGGIGDMAAHSLLFQAPLIAYPIPASVLADAHGQLLIAIRFSNQIRRYQARSLDAPVSANSGVFLESQDAAARDRSLRNSRIAFVELVQALIELLIGLVSLSLFLALRSQREYLAIAINLLAAGLGASIDIWRALHFGTIPFFIAIAVLNAIGSAAVLDFARLILRRPRTWLWLTMQAIAVLGSLSNPFALSGVGPIWATLVCVFAAILVADVLLPILLLRGGWRGNLDARVLLPAVLLGSLADYWTFILNAIFYLHISRTLIPLWAIPIGVYRLDVNDLGSFAFDITILLFIVLRTIRIARERAEAAGEIEAAQTTQQLLLARASQPTPGFAVESVYYPAGEVGGDFFLVSPDADGSLIAVVGDVSGKGLLAAMRVSMILGVLRREDSREPATILAHLNQALLSQGEMGFTTACCVRLEPSGRYTLVNAGHISPYIAGVEIVAPPALPLGLAPDQIYQPVTGVLAHGEKLVLMSDGVVEARSPQGELYGFDRLPNLTRMPAADIADIAQRFGQEDDITVLTIACGA